MDAAQTWISFQLLSRIWEALTRRIDRMLFVCALAIVGVGLVTLFSAADQSVQRVTSQLLSFGFAIVLMWLFANIPPQTLARAAVPLYVVAVLMLIGVAMFGIVVNGSRRWLNFGVARFQPSELMKIALPLMLAWYFQKFEGRIGWIDFVIAAILIVPGLGIAAMVWYMRRWRARKLRPQIALEALNQRYALGDIGRTEYLQTEMIFSQPNVRQAPPQPGAGNDASRHRRASMTRT